jgi:hypothetical protein
MFEGDGTVKPNWQQAGDLITQQTHIMLTELADADRRLRAAKRATEDAKRALESYKAKPDSYSEGWYVKELGKERERRQKVESDLRRAQEFMKLKDQAKIKVERVRDFALRDNKRLRALNEQFSEEAGKAKTLAIANEQQAVAWKEAVQEKNKARLEAARLRDEVNRLLDVIKLGREGLKNEQW